MVPDDKINEFVKRAREACGPNLEAILLFGSAASGDFRPGLSNINLFCVLRDSSFPKLQLLAPVVHWWAKQKQPPPLCMTRSELDRSTDVFTIELLDMAQHHRVLFGEDILQGLQIDIHLHRVQVEYELREKLILLRQHILLAAENRSKLYDVLLHSAPSFATLFRHALIVLGGQTLLGRREAIDQLAKQVQFDASAIEQVLNIREGKADARKFDLSDLCARYLTAIEKVVDAVDRALDSGNSAV